jgi:hypothetical protein
MLAWGVLVVCAALAQSANAQPRDLPGALLGIVTEPIGKILGTVERIGRSVGQRRPSASRPRPARAVAARAKANGAASSTGNAAASTAPAAARAAAAAAQAPRGATAAAIAATVAAAGGSAAAAVAPTETADIPIPTPAPGLRSVSLGQPGDVRHVRGNEPSRQPSRFHQEPSPLGVVGPLVWPSAYEDIVGFALWPNVYGERLRAHGIGDVVTAIFARRGTIASRPRVEMARAMAGERTRADMASAGSVRTCNGAVQATADWPANQIERATDLSSAQRSALEQFKASIAEAVAIINATCRNEAAPTPVERLRSMQNALWAVHDAAILIRTPLADFYASLSDDQKKQFIVPQSQANPHAVATAGQAMNQSDIARVCGMLPSGQWPMRRIEQSLRPTDAQRASLETLQKKLVEMGQFLMASCLQPMPSTPAARLDAAADRLTAVIFAASTVGLALNDFYNQLSEQQKTKFIAVSQ